jgi:hypothetical protein
LRGAPSSRIVFPLQSRGRSILANAEALRDDVAEDIADLGLKKAKLKRFVAGRE